jgi:hypothetical protein
LLMNLFSQSLDGRNSKAEFCDFVTEITQENSNRRNGNQRPKIWIFLSGTNFVWLDNSSCFSPSQSQQIFRWSKCPLNGHSEDVCNRWMFRCWNFFDSCERMWVFRLFHAVTNWNSDPQRVRQRNVHSVCLNVSQEVRNLPSCKTKWMSILIDKWMEILNDGVSFYHTGFQFSNLVQMNGE